MCIVHQPQVVNPAEYCVPVQTTSLGRAEICCCKEILPSLVYSDNEASIHLIDFFNVSHYQYLYCPPNNKCLREQGSGLISDVIFHIEKIKNNQIEPWK